MLSLSELAAQVDIALSKVPPASDQIPLLIHQAIRKIDNKESCEELSDIIFDLVPSLIIAAGLSKACEDAVKELLDVAAEQCAAREVYTALASALSEAMQGEGGSGTWAEEGTEPLGAASFSFQRSILRTMARSITRIKRRWVGFLEEYLSLAVQWFHWAQHAQHGDECAEADGDVDGFCRALGPLAASTKVRDGASDKEREQARSMLCHAVLQAVGSIMEHPGRLQAAGEAAQRVILEGQSTLSGKLFRFRPVLMEFLMAPEKVLAFVVEPLGVSTLDGLEHEATSGVLFHPEEEGSPGAAAAVCSAVLHTLPPATDTQATAWCLAIAESTGKTLEHLSLAVNALTDAAARHQSMVLALLPLLAVMHFAKQCPPLEEPYVSAIRPIASTLVAVMSMNPIEIVRTCAFEALNSLLDAIVPSARMVLLQDMMQMPSPAAVVVALQRIRLEISPAVLSPPFTSETALHLAVPYLRHGETPGWQYIQDVTNNADVMAAAMSVLRFVLLQRLAAGRKVEGQTSLPASIAETPLLLHPDKLDSFIEQNLKPLRACTMHALQIQSGQRGPDDGIELESFLALDRLNEVLDRTLEAGKQLLDQERSMIQT